MPDDGGWRLGQAMVDAASRWWLTFEASDGGWRLVMVGGVWGKRLWEAAVKGECNVASSRAVTENRIAIASHRCFSFRLDTAERQWRIWVLASENMRIEGVRNAAR